MKIGWLLSGTHVAAAVIGAAAIWIAPPPATAGLVAAAVAMVVALGVGLAAARRLQGAIGSVERVAAGGDDFADTSTGVWEVDRLAERIRQFAHRWSEAAADSRRQSREVEQLLSQLDRRAGARAGTARNVVGPLPAQRPEVPAERSESVSLQLRQLLGSIADSTDDYLQEIVSRCQGAEQAAQSVSSGADQQRETVSRTTAFVEQMTTQFDVVSENAGDAQRSVGEAREFSATAGRTLDELQRETGRLRLHVETAERKLRALGERSHEIGSILQMIGTISSRTDLLALNASIESYRGGGEPSGDHRGGGSGERRSVPSGRGFSVVAEEVRKLAEQTAQATREVTALIESIQQETQESILAMAEQRAHVEAEADQVRAAVEQLARAGEACNRSSGHIDDILATAECQLRLTQELVTNLESLSEGARKNRRRAEEAGWTLRTVPDVVGKTGDVLVPLRRCSDRDPSTRPATPTEGWSGAPDEAKHPSPGDPSGSPYSEEVPEVAGTSEAEDEAEASPALASVDAALSLVHDSLETS